MPLQRCGYQATVNAQARQDRRQPGCRARCVMPAAVPVGGCGHDRGHPVHQGLAGVTAGDQPSVLDCNMRMLSVGIVPSPELASLSGRVMPFARQSWQHRHIHQGALQILLTCMLVAGCIREQGRRGGACSCPRSRHGCGGIGRCGGRRCRG